MTREAFVTASILFLYLPKITFFGWAAWEYYRRWRLVLPADELTPEQQLTQTIGRSFSGSNALLVGMIALDSLAWLAILYLIPRFSPEQTGAFWLDYSLWIGTNAGQMLALFFILRQMGIIKWK